MSAKYPELGGATDKAKLPRKTFDAYRPEYGNTGGAEHVPVIICGGGPIGLACAADLAGHGVQSIVVERSNTVSDGSRAICWAKRTLEIFDRLGVGAAMAEKGVVWDVGKIFCGDSREPIYTFDLLSDKQQKMPAFVNLQQFYAEGCLIENITSLPETEIRWQNELIGVANGPDAVEVTIKTPDGIYTLSCDYLIAADGHRSPVRSLLGLEFEGRTFEDNFLIVDVRMELDGPAERRFWFDPPFARGKTALLHRQPDNVWRIDFQLGNDIDRDEELKPENVGRRVREFLGPDVEFEYEWVSIYRFSCLKMESFVHNRIVFAGDSAHLVSPFGARGANGGIQDQDNLGWKLAFILKGLAPPALMSSYDDERIYAADENLRNSSRSTDFLSPKNRVSESFRDAILELAETAEFARSFVNSGRLSLPSTLDGSPLNTPDGDDFTAKQRPGSPCMDAPVVKNGERVWLLDQLGWNFKGLYFSDGDDGSSIANALKDSPLPIELIVVGGSDADRLDDYKRLVADHYDATPGTFYLIRPDQHIAARWRSFSADKVIEAVKTATCRKN